MRFCKVLLPLCIWALTLADSHRVFAQLEPQPSDSPAPLSLTELPQPFTPRQPRSEGEQDRLTSATHYLQARLLTRPADRAAALRHFERAWRYDPEQAKILAELVPLAFELQRGDEAARYAVIAAEIDSKDVTLLVRLAEYLTQQHDYARALRLYEQALAVPGRESLARTNDPAITHLHDAAARLYILQGDHAAAAAHFEKVQWALDFTPSWLSAADRRKLLGKPHETYQLWGECYLQALRYDEAAAAFKKSHDLQADLPLLAIKLAQVEAGKGNNATALATLDEFFALKSTAHSDEGCTLLGDLIRRETADQKQAHAKLVERLQQLRQYDSVNAGITLALADALFEADRIEEAEKLYATQPTSAHSIARFAEIYRQQGKVEKLLSTIGESALETSSLDLFSETSAKVAADKPFLAKLIATVRRREKAERGSLGSTELFAAALLALEAKEFAAADEFFESLLASGSLVKRKQIFLAWGMSLFQADQHARAAKVFQQIVDEKLEIGGPGGAHYYLAGALAMDNRPDEALPAIKLAIHAEPGKTRYEGRLGWILYHAKRYADAERAYRELLATYDASHHNEAIRQTLQNARLMLSNIALQQDDFPAAVEWLEQVLDEFPEDASALNDLGYLWAERGLHPERALRMTQQAVAAQPENLAYRDSLGWAYYQVGRYDEALRELLLATSDPESDGVVLDHLGDIHSKLDQPDLALAAYRRSLAAFQKSGDTKKAALVEFKVQGLKFKVKP